MTKVKYFIMNVFTIVAKIQFLGSENICTCRTLICWLFWVKQDTLVKGEREHMKIFRSD